jgi:hypothetical protein
MGFLAGYKSYGIAALMVIVAGLHAQGYLNDGTKDLLQGLLLGGGIAALRAGIASSKQ